VEATGFRGMRLRAKGVDDLEFSALLPPSLVLAQYQVILISSGLLGCRCQKCNDLGLVRVNEAKARLLGSTAEESTAYTVEVRVRVLPYFPYFPN
jgi:hypothetical protein